MTEPEHIDPDQSYPIKDDMIIMEHSVGFSQQVEQNARAAMTEEELFGLTDDEKRRHRFQRPVDPNALLRSDLRNIKIELGQIRDRIAILSQRLNDKAGQVDVVDDAHTGRLWLRRAIDDLEEAEEYVGCVIKKTQT